MSQSNQTQAPNTSAVLTDAETEIRFGFKARSRIQSGIGINENSPYIDEIKKPFPVKADIIFTGDIGRAVLTPAGYTMTMPLRRIDRKTLDDKYHTALTYIDRIVTDNPRNFNPSLVIAGSDPASTFREYEDILTAWGEEQFETDAKKNILGSNKQVSLTYKGGPAIRL